jgi:hypothetical protein
LTISISICIYFELFYSGFPLASDDEIAHVKITNGVPLVYTLDENLEPVLDLVDDIGFQAKYLSYDYKYEYIILYVDKSKK